MHYCFSSWVAGLVGNINNLAQTLVIAGAEFNFENISHCVILLLVPKSALSELVVLKPAGGWRLNLRWFGESKIQFGALINSRLGNV